MKLVFLLIFTLLFVNNSNSLIDYEKLKNFKILSIANDTIKFRSILKKNTMIIFYNNYSCADCLKNLISSSKTTYKNQFNIVMIIRSDENIVSRKIDLTRVNNKFKIKKILFDCNKGIDSWPPKNLEGGLFGFFKIEKTPAVLMCINFNKIHYFSYEKLSSNNFLIENLINNSDEQNP
jgi:hypothetical protein